MRPFLRMVFGYILLVVLALGVPALASTNSRPFWTEQSSYVEGDTLYGVGVATRAPSSEAGRQQAYEHGTNELSNFAQVTDLSGLLIETQMTYEEPNRDGTVTVFRLLKVSMAQLTQWKAQLLEQATSAVQHQQRKVAEKTTKLEQEAQQLKSLMKREQEIQETVLRLAGSVSKVRCGMTMAEVGELLGAPRARDPALVRGWFDSVEPPDVFGNNFWNYGDRWLTFKHGILIATDRSKMTVAGWGCPQ